MKRLILTMGIVLAMLACGCAASSGDAGAAGHAQITAAPLATLVPSITQMEGTEQAESRAPYVEPRVEELAESVLIYPYVYGNSGAYSINSAMAAAIDQIAAQGPVFVDYSLECNRGGLLSVVLHVYDWESYEQATQVAMTFDWATGERYNIAQLFATNEEEERWRGSLPDIVTQQAEKKDMTLICDVLPVTDDQIYYVNGDSLVLVYRPYEIATYAAGMPEFSISLTDIQGLMGEESPLKALLAENQALLAETSAAMDAAGNADANQQNKEAETEAETQAATDVDISDQ